MDSFAGALILTMVDLIEIHFWLTINRYQIIGSFNVAEIMNTSTSAGFPKMKLISNGYPLNTAQDMDTTQLETEELSTLRKTKDNHTDVVGVVLSLSSLNLNVAPIVTTDTLANSRPDTAADEFQSSHLTGSTSILIDGNTTTDSTLDVSEDDFPLSSLMGNT